GEELVMQNGTNGLHLPHRSGTVTRNSSGIRLFFPKTESSFSRIERHGGDPKSYTWHVYDKSGTRYTYNQPLDGTNGIGPASNAGKWYLTRVEDKNGNYIQYHIYPQGGGVNGTEIRLNRIDYSIHPSLLQDIGNGDLAYYQVHFKYKT